jgi:oxygen-dependent protoporphyrinogen oxidase
LGGGISGLVALHNLARSGAVEVTLHEASSRLGGKILGGWLGDPGIPVELGPDGFVSRGSELPGLCDALGIGDEIVPAAHGDVRIWSRGRLRPLPHELVMGLPVHPLSLVRSRLLSVTELLRLGLDLVLPASRLPQDVTVATLVGARLGRGAVQRLVEPLVGGVYAGTAESLGVDSVLPGLRSRLDGRRSLIRVLRSGQPAAAPSMVTLRGGLTTLVEALRADALARGARIQLGSSVSGLRAAPGGGYELLVKGAGAGRANAVVVAVPGRAAAAIVAPLAAATEPLGRIAYAPVSVVALLYPATAVDGGVRGIGFLACRADGGMLRACTWTDRKWPHLAREGVVLARCSMGGIGDRRAVELDDRELAERAHAELSAAVPLRQPPRGWLVARWPRAIPQYAPGHRLLIESVRSHLPLGIHLAGAAYEGVGLSACARQGRIAAQGVLDDLAGQPPDRGAVSAASGVAERAARR